MPEGGTLLEFGCGRTFRSTKLLGDQFSKRFATDIVDVQPHEVPGGVDFRRCTTTENPFAREHLSFFVPLYTLGALYQFGISILSMDVLQPSFVVLLRKRNGTRP